MRFTWVRHHTPSQTQLLLPAPCTAGSERHAPKRAGRGGRVVTWAVVALVVLVVWVVPHESWVDAVHGVLPIPVHHVLHAPGGGALAWAHRPPPVNARVHAAPWPGSWDVADLRRPDEIGSAAEELGEPPALLMLHIFSQSTEAAARKRQLIREHSPLATIPKRYQHLIDVKFVLGRPHDTLAHDEVDRVNAEVDAEMEAHGDMIRLEGLLHGENMNEGKTLEWIEHVGRDGARQAWWVFKCDDDTVPLLPNLLPYLLEHDPRTPTYIGSPYCASDLSFYAQGMMYGMSWGIVKTLAAAGLTDAEKHVNFHEDRMLGRLLPPNASTVDTRRALCECGAAGVPAVVRSAPDGRTGLVRLNLHAYFGDYWLPWTKGWQQAMAWHGLKSEKAWLAGYDAAVDGFASAGRRFMWEPSEAMRHLAADM